MSLDSALASVLDSPIDDAYDDAIRIAMELGIHTVDAEEGSLLVLEESTRQLVFEMTAGDMLSESTLRGQHVAVGQGLSGLAALTGEIQVGAPANASVRHPEHRNELLPSYLIAAPMFAGKHLVGVLTAATYRPRQKFSADQIRIFGRVAALAGIVVAERLRNRPPGDLRSQPEP
jgi:GAF domain-containing protein